MDSGILNRPVGIKRIVRPGFQVKHFNVEASKEISLPALNELRAGGLTGEGS
jgi:hypothetical protein